MKHLLLLTALFSIQFSTLQAQFTTEDWAMQTFAQEYMAAYNRQDISALRSMQMRDIMGDSLYHRDHIVKSFEDAFTRQNVTLFMRQIRVEWSDAEHALVAIGTYEGHGATIVYDIPLDWKTAYRNTMVQDSGRWKIARSVVTDIAKTIIYQKTGKVDEWQSAFHSALQESSVLDIETGKSQSDSGTAYALLEWPSMEVAKAFFEKPNWYKALPTNSKSEKPTVVFLNDK